MAHIFISYSRQDKAFAYRLAADLDRLGGDVWIDRDDIHAAEKWADAINRALNECPVMILILTPESMASENVSDEWQYFRHRNKPIIPVLLKPTEIHFQLARLQYLDFHTQEYDTAFAQLHSELLRQGIPLKPLHTGNTLIPIPAQQPLPIRPQDLNRPVIWTSAFIAAGIALAAVLSLLGVFGGGEKGNTPQPTSTDVESVVATTPEPVITDTPTPTLTDTPTSVPTDTPTSVPTDTPSPTEAATLTPVPTMTEIPTATLPPATPLPTLISAGTLNNSWTPVERDIDGVPMVYVPAGCWIMGSNEGGENERPPHETCLDTAFWIDKTEVTNAQFSASSFHATYASRWTDANRPRENITWDEAQAYCEQRGARLPTEAEWEYAARGPEGWKYPWGGTVSPENVVYGENSGGQTAPVGSKPGGASWVGALDMSGNVYEWVADYYGSYSASYAVNPTGPLSGDMRVLRSGSWDDGQFYIMRTTYRVGDYPASHYSFAGFRCARSANE